MKIRCSMFLLAVAAGLIPAIAGAGPSSSERVSLIQPIGKGYHPVGPVPPILDLTGLLSTGTVSGADIAGPDGVLLDSLSNLFQYDRIVLSTTTSDTLTVFASSEQPAFTSWTADKTTLTANSDVTFTRQTGGAYIGQFTGLDMDNQPTFAEARLFVDPATIPNLQAFRNSTFTITAYAATPEPGIYPLMGSLALTGAALLRRRRGRLAGPSHDNE